jgi:hypothetical protein
MILRIPIRVARYVAVAAAGRGEDAAFALLEA